MINKIPSYLFICIADLQRKIDDMAKEIEELKEKRATVCTECKKGKTRKRKKEKQGDQSLKDEKLRKDREGTTSKEPTEVERQWLEQKKVNSELSDRIEDNKKSVANIEIKQNVESAMQLAAGVIQADIFERQNEVIVRQNNTEQRLNNTEQRLNNTEQRLDNTEQRVNHVELRQDNTEQRVNDQDETITNLDQVGFSTNLIYNLKPSI